jgi:hypothetical protein
MMNQQTDVCCGWQPAAGVAEHLQHLMCWQWELITHADHRSQHPGVTTMAHACLVLTSVLLSNLTRFKELREYVLARRDALGAEIMPSATRTTC